MKEHNWDFELPDLRICLFILSNEGIIIIERLFSWAWQAYLTHAAEDSNDEELPGLMKEFVDLFNFV